MLRRALILLAGGLVALPLLNEPAEAQSARCGFYAGMGYRCFGTAGGTGGRVFRQMDANTRRCGYFNPGCVGRSAQPIYRAPVLGSTRLVTGGYARPSFGGYARPSIGSGYARPSVGSGYVRPSVGPGYVRPSVGPGYVRPSVGPGYVRPSVGSGYVRPSTGYLRPVVGPGYRRPAAS